MPSVSIQDKREKDTETQRRRPCDHEGRDWGDVTTSPGMLGPPEAAKGKEGVYPGSFRGREAL